MQRFVSCKECIYFKEDYRNKPYCERDNEPTYADNGCYGGAKNQQDLIMRSNFDSLTNPLTWDEEER